MPGQPGAPAGPEPAVMPVDRQAWADEVHLSMFVNAYCQLRDVRRHFPQARSILIIGPGQGLEKTIFGWKQYQVTTFDIDETFEPDILGSCHDLSMFADDSFDVVIASHVLEHLPPKLLDTALGEIARVAPAALIYLPVAGRHMIAKLNPGFGGHDWSVVFDLVRRATPDPATPIFERGQHYWEIGHHGYRLRDIRARLCKVFTIVNDYRNRDWLPSHNFILAR